MLELTICTRLARFRFCVTDDTSDITIPSAFVSRASYLSLLRVWEEEQEGLPDGEPARGLLVVLSKDEMFTWYVLARCASSPCVRC